MESWKIAVVGRGRGGYPSSLNFQRFYRRFRGAGGGASKGYLSRIRGGNSVVVVAIIVVIARSIFSLLRLE